MVGLGDEIVFGSILNLCYLCIQEKKERQRQDAAEAETKAAEEARAAAPDQAQEGTPPATDAAASVSAKVRA